MARHWLLPSLRRLKIQKKNLEIVRLGDVMTPPQAHLINLVEEQMTQGRPVRIIILKARQMGFSTIVEGIGFTSAFALPGLKGVVVAHDNPSAEHILSMTRLYWDTWWAKDLFTSKSTARNRLEWEETKSLLKISTAKNVATGRGYTYHFIHNSEVAFYADPTTLMTGLNQSIPREPFTFQFLESTANGVGNWFYRTWQAAKEGETDFYPVFYPWWQHPAYRAESIGMGYRVSKPLTSLDDEEKIIAGALNRMGFDLSEIKSRLIWRRSVLRTECGGDVETFHQEYPSTDDEAFVATGNNVFDLAQLNKVYEPMEPNRGELVREGTQIRFIPRPDGAFAIYREPDPSEDYMVAGDASKAATKGDYAVAQVINRRTFEQVAVYRKRIIPELFAQEMLKIGDFYNHAMLAPETNMSGGAVAAILRTSYYDHVFMHRKANRVPGQIDRMFGWVTNMQTKAEAIGALQTLIYDETNPENPMPYGFKIHDAATYQEMKGYITTDAGSYEASGNENSEHDDTVMALAIAVVCTKYESTNLPPRRSRLKRIFDEMGEEIDGLEMMLDATVKP